MSSSGDVSQQPSPDAPSGGSTELPNNRTSCDLCKRMKIRCERQGETCTHCISRGVKCEVTFVPRKKHAKRGNAYLDVENRIKRLESMLSASGVDVSKALDGNSAQDQSRTTVDLTDRLSTLFLSGTDEASRFIGPSSGFSLFSPQGLQWISEITGTNELSQLIQRESLAKHGFPQRRAEIFQPLPEHELEPLPPKEVAEYYVQFYFDTFNTVLPLYDRETFNGYFERQYSGTPPPGAAWYASLNVVISMGSLIWGVQSQLDVDMTYPPYLEPVEDQAWKYFRNACSCFIDLILKDCNLMAVQALCGIAFIQQIKFDPQPLSILIPTAVRLAYGIGLHRKLDGFGLSQSEIEQRRNIFWTIYVMDKSIALRSGQPSSITDEDIGVDLPPARNVMQRFPDGSVKVDIFRSQAQLAQLESRIYSELYSIRSRNRSDLERLKTVSQLDSELQQWREELPIEIRPEMPIKCAMEQFMPVVMMHFGYFNCLATVHRVSITHGLWASDHAKQAISTPDHQQLNPRVYSSRLICLETARNSIQLLKQTAAKGRSIRDNFLWTAMYYPLSSFIILFANTLQNPRDSYVASDLRLMSYVTSLLNPIVENSPFTGITFLKFFTELSNVALKFVEKTNSGSTKKLKRGNDRRDIDQNDDVPLHSNESVPMGASLYSNINPSTSVNMGLYTDPQYFETSPQVNVENISTPSGDSPLSAEALQYMKQYPNSYDFGNQPAAPLTDPLLLPPEMDMFDPSINNPLLMSENDMRYPTMMPDAPLLADFFEWDLAALMERDPFGLL